MSVSGFCAQRGENAPDSEKKTVVSDHGKRSEIHPLPPRLISPYSRFNNRAASAFKLTCLLSNSSR